MIDFDQIFDDYVRATPKTFAHDRTLTVGGSEIFGCLRKSWFKRNNAPKDPDHEESWGATRRGDLIENHHVVPALLHGVEAMGADLIGAGENQKTLFDADGYLSVTPDGLVANAPADALAKYGVPDLEGDSFLIEIKSIDPRVNLVEEKAVHHGQTQVQLGIIRETTEFRPMYAVILYVDCSFFDDVEVFVVRYEAAKFAAAKARAKRVMTETDPNALTREGRIDGGCGYCPYTHACARVANEAMPPESPKFKKGQVSDPEVVAALAPLVESHKIAASEAKKHAANLAGVKESVAAKLREIGQTRATDGTWSVSYFWSRGRKSLDKASLYAAVLSLGVDLAQYETAGAGFDTLKITYKGVKEESESDA